MEKNVNVEVDKSKLVFAQKAEKINDQKLDTKSRTYLQDAFFRFKRNKASIVAAFIIGIMFLYAIIVPMLSPYSVSYQDSVFEGTLPRNELFVNMGIDFWDGAKNEGLNLNKYTYYRSMNVETNAPVFKNNQVEIVTEKDFLGREQTTYNVRLDSYHKEGMQFLNLSEEEYISLQKYQDEKNIQVIYPITDVSKRPQSVSGADKDANYWFLTEIKSQQTVAVLDAEGNFTNIYQAYTGKDNYTSKMRVEGEGAQQYDYANITSAGMYNVRVNYYDYYIFYNSYYLGNNINRPSFLFGTTVNDGQDIFVCLASGARFSFILGVIVALVNFIVGVIFGAIEGYYGGKVDMLMQRFVEILRALPLIIVYPLMRYHFDNVNVLLLLFMAFFLTGWIGISGTTRVQFYRYKNQEYVLAARTLGAKDRRIMARHIFPNAVGTLITSVVLTIPSVILSETSLSYLGIINLSTGDRTSVGTLLANAQGSMTSSPHMILFPAIFISLLILSFNLFGNGLRDAFNPSLRGSED